MRRWIVPVALLCVAVGNAQSKPAGMGAGAIERNSCSPDDESALRRIGEQWKDGYNRGNAAQVASLYTGHCLCPGMGCIQEWTARQKLPQDAERSRLVKQELPGALHDGFLSAESSNFQLISF